MNQTILGRNIRYLRKIHGETLKELGDILGYQNNTIAGYESGDRNPDTQTLSKISTHYNIPVDELLYTDLIDDNEVTLIDFNSEEQMSDMMRAMFPLFVPKKGIEDKKFQKALQLSKKIRNGAYNSENGEISESVKNMLFDYYSEVSEECFSAAIPNLISSIFMLWVQIVDPEQYRFLYHKLEAKEVKIKDFANYRSYEDETVKEKRVAFLDEFEETVVELLQEMKQEYKMSDLVDFYLALRYILRFSSNEMSEEMKTTAGYVMMASFLEVNNKYADHFFQVISGDI